MEYLGQRNTFFNPEPPVGSSFLSNNSNLINSGSGTAMFGGGGNSLTNNSSPFNSATEMASKTATEGGGGLMGTLSSVASIARPIGQAVGVIGNIAGKVMDYYAAKDTMHRQEEADQRAQANYRTQVNESNRRYDKEFGLKEKEMALNEKTANFNMKMTKEKIAADNMANALGKMMVFMNSNASRGQLMSIWPGRG